MNSSYSQTPPIPPSVNSNAGEGITYSEAETNTSYAFSCAFNKIYLRKIKEIVSKEFNDFNEKLYLKNKQFKVKIELNKKELKMEYKSFNGKVSEEKNKLKSIASKIIEL